jgi:hypothetical protein
MRASIRLQTAVPPAVGAGSGAEKSVDADNAFQVSVSWVT